MNKYTLVGKILITGELTLQAPLLIGDGEGETSDNFKDVHVLKNQEDKPKPFIPGTSLCGVLRDYMKSTNPAMVDKIFGDANTIQSSIQLDDIQLDNGEIISRDGVKIDSYTGTSVDGSKYDYEAVDRGAKGNLRLLINLRGVHLDDMKNVQDAISKLMGRLKSGIQLGALTSKGFGVATVENIVANFYDFRNKADVIAWLKNKPASKTISPASEKNSSNPKDFIVDANFALNSSFIIRDYDVGEDNKSNNISAVSLKSQCDFVIPATSLKGIFRHRAEYIFNRLGLKVNLLDNLMGTATKDGTKIKSRFIVYESYISPKNVNDVIHRRNKIDRITGGVLQGTLFATKPVWNKTLNAPIINIRFEIRDAKDFEAGLALCLLRDMWLGNVAIGGEKSIGRGTVKGIFAEIKFKGKTYNLAESGKVIKGDAAEISKIANAVKNWGGDE